MKVLAVDPGTEQSAILIFDSETRRIAASEIAPNADVRAHVEAIAARGDADVFAIEWVSFYGKDVNAGSETFHTCRWAGRFQDAWASVRGEESVVLLTRQKVRTVLTGLTRGADDSAVRRVLIDRFGGKAIAVGKKKNPGPLYEIATHLWAALAVAVVYADGLS